MQIQKSCNSATPTEYALETAQHYVRLYPWYHMPASAHKLLIHGADAINHLLLPIVMFSEEAQEARNKHLRSFRLHHARKDSRVHTMTDVAQQLFVTSDPVISGLIWAQMTPNIAKKADHGGNPLLKGQRLQGAGDVSESDSTDGTDEE